MRSEIRLKYIARNIVHRITDSARPHVTLEDVEVETGRLRADYAPTPKPGVDGVIAFESGDVLFGKLRSYLRKSLLCVVSGYCSPELLVLRPSSGLTSSYLAYLVRSSAFVSWAVATSDGVKMPRTSWDELGDFRFVLPSESEQRGIVAELDRALKRLDVVMAQKQRLQTLLEQQRVAIVESGVAGLLTSTEERKNSRVSWLSDIPKNWDDARLKYIATLGTGHTPSRRVPEWWDNCTVPWITTSDVHKFRDDRLEVLNDTEQNISELGLANSSAVLHPSGTVVLSRTASVGFSAIMGKDMATSQDFVTWTCSARILPDFLLYCLRAMRSDLLGRLAQGSTHQTIYMPDIERLIVPLPPIEEQRLIVAAVRRRLRPTDRLIKALEDQRPKLSEYRRGLIDEALTGAHRGSAAA